MSDPNISYYGLPALKNGARVHCVIVVDAPEDHIARVTLSPDAEHKILTPPWFIPWLRQGLHVVAVEYQRKRKTGMPEEYPHWMPAPDMIPREPEPVPVVIVEPEPVKKKRWWRRGA